MKGFDYMNVQNYWLVKAGSIKLLLSHSTMINHFCRVFILKMIFLLLLDHLSALHPVFCVPPPAPGPPRSFPVSWSVVMTTVAKERGSHDKGNLNQGSSNRDI